MAVINQNPCKSSNRSCKICDNASHRGTKIASETTATIESEPSEPEEYCSENDVGNVVGTIFVFFGSVITTLAQQDRICESSSTRRDVYRCTAGEIETS